MGFQSEKGDRSSRYALFDSEQTSCNAKIEDLLPNFLTLKVTQNKSQLRSGPNSKVAGNRLRRCGGWNRLHDSRQTTPRTLGLSGLIRWTIN